MRTTLTPEYLLTKIKDVTYLRIEGTTTTVCAIHLHNGFTVTGESACVTPENFSESIGQKIAYENALHKLWPLEGYLLAEQIYLSKPKVPFLTVVPGTIVI